MRFIKKWEWEVEQEDKIFFLLGPVYMASGTRERPPPRDNLTERLHDNCVTDTKLTLLNYGDVENNQLLFFLPPCFLSIVAILNPEIGQTHLSNLQIE